MTRKEAIVEKCLDCCCGQKAEVRKCDIKKCPLWQFRLGKDLESTRTSNLTEEQRQEIAERLKRSREKK